MRIARTLLALALVVVLQVLIVDWWPGAAHFVDLFSLVVVLYALSGELVPAILVGAAVGLAHDAFSGAPFGLHGFADTLTAYVTALAARQLVVGRALGAFALVAAATLFERLVLVGLLALLVPGPVAVRFPWLLLAVLVNGVLGALLFALGLRLRERRSQRGQTRSTKIRFGR
ncbi:MAG TPA: hypothetical protein VKA53_06610 [Thermoanaerobaculia bacterium]|nr:hypothetical protein [Thermoanaerobaculia bacterium]